MTQARFCDKINVDSFFLENPLHEMMFIKISGITIPVISSNIVFQKTSYRDLIIFFDSNKFNQDKIFFLGCYI